jgi:rare lipoprotein A
MRRSFAVAVVAILSGLLLAGCSSSKKSASLDPFAGKGSPYYKGTGPLPKGGGRYHVGKPYQVAGRWFTPKEDSDYDKTGIASWYGPQFHRRQTSNGEWFDMNELTAAHATLPLPSYAKVTNLENGRQVIVRINDRGPFVGTRIIDLSRRSADALGFKNQGKAKVRVQYIGPAPLDDDGRHLVAMNRELVRGTPLRSMIARADGRSGSPTLIAAAPPPKSALPVAPPVAAAPIILAQSKPAPPSNVPFRIAAVDGGYFVQVGTFASAANAERMRAELAAVGPVQIMPLEGSQGMVYRVRLGPIASAEQAGAALQHVVHSGHSDARVIVAQSYL